MGGEQRQEGRGGEEKRALCGHNPPPCGVGKWVWDWGSDVGYGIRAVGSGLWCGIGRWGWGWDKVWDMGLGISIEIGMWDWDVGYWIRGVGLGFALGWGL